MKGDLLKGAFFEVGTAAIATGATAEAAKTAPEVHVLAPVPGSHLWKERELASSRCITSLEAGSKGGGGQRERLPVPQFSYKQ